MVQHKLRTTLTEVGLCVGALLLAACPGDDPPPIDTEGTGSSGGTDGTMNSADDTVDSDSSGGSGGTDTGPVDCEYSTYPDDITIDVPGEAVSGDIVRLADFGGQIVGCGDGFVQAVGGSELAIDGLCSGVAAIDGGQGVVVTTTGSTILLGLDGTTLTALDTVEDAALRHEDVAVHDGAVFVASGADGLSRFDVAADLLGAATAVPGANDARGLASVPAGLLVADGSDGARLVDPDGGGSLTVLDLDPEAKVKPQARRVMVEDGRAYVTLGAFGVRVVDVADQSLSLVTSVPSEGMALGAASVDGGVLVATGSALVRYSIADDGTVVMVSREARPAYGELVGGWFTGMLVTSEGLFASLGTEVTRVVVGDGEAQPLVHVTRATYSFWAEQGAPTETIITVDNRGAAPMILTDISAGPFPYESINLEERPGCPGLFTIEGGSRGLVQITYEEPAAEVYLGSFTATTNTSDDEMYELRVEANRAPPTVDDPAPPFEVLSSEGDLLRSTDYEDRVVFMKVFNET